MLWFIDVNGKIQVKVNCEIDIDYRWAIKELRSWTSLSQEVNGYQQVTDDIPAIKSINYYNSRYHNYACFILHLQDNRIVRLTAAGIVDDNLPLAKSIIIKDGYSPLIDVLGIDGKIYSYHIESINQASYYPSSLTDIAEIIRVDDRLMIINNDGVIHYGMSKHHIGPVLSIRNCIIFLENGSIIDLPYEPKSSEVIMRMTGLDPPIIKAPIPIKDEIKIIDAVQVNDGYFDMVLYITESRQLRGDMGRSLILDITVQENGKTIELIPGRLLLRFGDQWIEDVDGNIYQIKNVDVSTYTINVIRLDLPSKLL